MKLNKHLFECLKHGVLEDSINHEHEAAASGLMSKPLTQPGVEKALKDFGLDADSASHQSLASLSHGQLNV